MVLTTYIKECALHDYSYTLHMRYLEFGNQGHSCPNFINTDYGVYE